MYCFSKPDLAWEGFQPRQYWLSTKVLDLGVTMTRETGTSKETVSVTIGELLGKPESQNWTMQWGLDVTITTAAEEIVLSGPSFHLHLLLVLHEFRREGINPFASSWYWYDSDSCLEDPQDHFTFFVVADGRIVKDSISFTDYHGSEFDPTVFQCTGNDRPSWANEEAMIIASRRYWYRKFYRETLAGQLMILRPDQPSLYYLEDEPAGSKQPPSDAIVQHSLGAQETAIVNRLNIIESRLVHLDKLVLLTVLLSSVAIVLRLW